MAEGGMHGCMPPSLFGNDTEIRSRGPPAAYYCDSRFGSPLFAFGAC